MNAYIKSIGAYIPKKRVTNDELSKTMDTSDEWIRSHTGIGSRHIAEDGMTTADIGTYAAQKALERADLKPEDIDMVILTTATPDYVGFPATSCIIQDKLGAVNAGAFDLTAGCTGFVYGLEVAKNFIENGSMKNILLVSAEMLTKIANWEDRNTAVLFGDGAGAAVISADESGVSGIDDTILKADGSGAPALERHTGGVVHPYEEGKTTWADTALYMDGQAVYKFAVKVNSILISSLLERNKLTIDDLAWIVPHQANKRIIQAAAKRLKLPLDKFFMNLEEYANTSSASIPIALNDMYENGKLKRGDKLLLTGFGAGLTYGGSILRW